MTIGIALDVAARVVAANLAAQAELRTQIAGTSMLAYAQLKAGRKLQPMEQRVLNALMHRTATREEIAHLTGMRLSSVCGRVRSLLCAGLIEAKDYKHSEESGKLQELLGLTFNEGDVNGIA